MNPEQVIDPWFPGPGGVRFRFFTFMPSSATQLQDVQGESSNFVEAFDPERPGMHISDTIDYVHVLSGEMILELERGEVLVKAGDLIVMRGGWHNWRTSPTSPARCRRSWWAPTARTADPTAPPAAARAPSSGRSAGPDPA